MLSRIIIYKINKILINLWKFIKNNQMFMISRIIIHKTNKILIDLWKSSKIVKCLWCQKLKLWKPKFKVSKFTQMKNSWLTYSIYSTNHKHIAIIYLLFALFSSVIGLLFSIYLRIELSICCDVFRYELLYNIVVTIHAITIIFFVIMPVLIGTIVNYILPLLLGLTDIVYPRMNSVAFWLLPPAFVLFITSITMIHDVGTGWTMYPTLRTHYSAGTSIDCMLFSLHLAGISSIIGSINFITTTLRIRIWSLSVNTCRIVVVAIAITAILLVLAVPVLARAITMLIIDRTISATFFDSVGGGDPTLYQHLFWFFGHPEVYILILPGFGISTYVVIAVTGKIRMVNTDGMIICLLSIAVIGFVVWSHHIFTTGLDADTRVYYMLSTIIIAVPTGIKVFTWIHSWYLECITHSYNIYRLLSSVVLIFITLFTFGGITGIILANTIVDVILHDRYYVVAHFHYVLSIGSVFSILLAYVIWMQLVTGTSTTIGLTQMITYIVVISVNILFFPLHFVGLHRIPRRYTDYPDRLYSMNLVASWGSVAVIVWVLTFLAVTLTLKLCRRSHEWTEYHCDYYSIACTDHTVMSSPYVVCGDIMSVSISSILVVLIIISCISLFADTSTFGKR